jgi:hypothetical protein
MFSGLLFCTDVSLTGENVKTLNIRVFKNLQNVNTDLVQAGYI